MPAGIARLNPFDRPFIRPAYSRAIRALVFDPAGFDPAQFDLTRFDPNDMDPTQLTHVSLCAGYGGIDLGLRRVLPGLRTIAYSEIEEYACGLLAARMESGHLDPAPIWSDLKTFPFSDFHGCVDILSGGYPCQPFSAAGKRRGTDDPRHLWPFIADGIRLCQPRICFFENVEGHISLGLRDVIGDLGRLGYQATWGIFSASEVGAPHQRKRVFILAHRDGIGRRSGDSKWQNAMDAESGCPERMRDQGRVPTEMAHAAGQGFQRHSKRYLSKEHLEPRPSCSPSWPSRPGEPQHAWEPPRVVANAFRNGRSKAERDAATMGGEERSEEGCKSESGPVASSADGGSSMGDAQSERPTTLRSEYEGFLGELCAASSSGKSESDGRKAQPALGGDVDGRSGGMDYAELCLACDNRTDELRLLGNGVVPATAALAFRTLLTQLDHDLR